MAMAVRRVCIIGAGAGGLVTAHYLRRFLPGATEIEILEQRTAVGGQWVYDADPSDDPHATSMFESLRTNLPAQLMRFRCGPHFSAADDDGDGDGDGEISRSFVSHRTVRRYLERCGREWDVAPLVRFGCGVRAVLPLWRGGDGENASESTRRFPRWLVSWESGSAEYDAVAVCTGHYQLPRYPAWLHERDDLVGDDEGCVTHAHVYRGATEYAGQRVLVVGAAASGVDISRELAGTAAHVWVSHRAAAGTGDAAVLDAIDAAHPQITTVGEVRAVGAERNADGSLAIELVDGRTLPAIDRIICCTGYRYGVAALFGHGSDAAITDADNFVRPLHRQCMHASLRSLAFIGVPWKVVPFPLMEAQARWLAAMWADPVRTADADLAADQRPPDAAHDRHAHRLGGLQWEYCDALARDAGLPRHTDREGDEWYWHPPAARAVYADVAAARRRDPAGYRDRRYRIHGDERDQWSVLTNSPEL